MHKKKVKKMEKHKLRDTFVDFRKPGFKSDLNKIRPNNIVNPIEIFRTLHNNKSLELFQNLKGGTNNNHGYRSSDLINFFEFSRKEFYSRMNNLIRCGLAKRLKGDYQLTMFGHVINSVCDDLMLLANNYWVVNAIDIIREAPNFNTEHLPDIMNQMVTDESVRSRLNKVMHI